METLFFIYGEKQFTYQKLIEDLNTKTEASSFVYVEHNDPYELFLQIIHSLVYDYPIEVLDGDFSHKELMELQIDLDALVNVLPVKGLKVIEDLPQLRYEISQTSDWTITLYTSGTTGRPKKVMHTFQSLTRNVKISERFKTNVWAFAYNPSHIAGLQVFLQALLNQNIMVYAFDGYQKQLVAQLEKHGITHISATPTFYRSILPSLKERQFAQVKRVTFGGEKYDPRLEKTIAYHFPYAHIRNIYASTEAGSLFTAKGELFEVPQNMKPFVKTNKSNELFIHESIVGESRTLLLENGWFKTGDVIEQVNENQFRFISRKSEVINVGGYKVNPNEVEAILNELPGVIDLVVKPRENKLTGYILVADVVKETDVDSKDLKKAIRQFGLEHLQEWKVPRIITFVDEIPRNRAGKKVR